MITMHKIPLQCWIGSTDVNGMLTEIGGWHIGCYNERRSGAAVAYAIDREWVGKRTHYFPDGKTSPAYELTDAGLQRIEDSYGPKAREKADERRQWYRNRAATAQRSMSRVTTNGERQ
jgi:hypothetical protein